MIVVDANVLAYLLIDGVHTAAAQAQLQRDPHWHAPQLWRSELLSVLAGELRRSGMSWETALEILGVAADLMLGRSHEVVAENVLRLVRTSPCSAYDLEYVALAMELGVPLVTMDRQLLREFPGTAVALAQV
ncbi:MAG TPA: type II toxin-antitoxin system VapC family toxin [Terriglobales bacterium]|nr:type II toxin-antitoxin system VapC family toxin [Terriglobales bacterium]